MAENNAMELADRFNEIDARLNPEVKNNKK